MPKKRLNVNWKREIGKEDLKPAVKLHRRYLEDNGRRASSIFMYVQELRQKYSWQWQLPLGIGSRRNLTPTEAESGFEGDYWLYKKYSLSL